MLDSLTKQFIKSSQRKEKLFKMKVLSLVLLAIIFVVVAKKDDNIEMSTSFHKLGYYASQLNFAHINSSFDLQRLISEHEKITAYLEDKEQAENYGRLSHIFQMLRKQLEISSTTLQRLQVAFFGKETHRDKRQAMAALSMGFGIFGLGTSIYNTMEIGKLRREMEKTQEEVSMIMEKIDVENEAVNKLSASVMKLKQTCQKVIEVWKTFKVQMDHLFTLTLMVNEHNTKILEVARGLESLLHGNLDPSLVNTLSLEKTLKNLNGKANEQGLKLLHREIAMIFKSPITYVALENGSVEIIVHIPLVKQDPIELYEYTPIPITIGNLIVTVESQKNILAVDKNGNIGLELTRNDLIQCQVENTHDGKVYLCPNSNLVRNNVRNTCLGSLMSGRMESIRDRCHHLVEQSNVNGEFAKQINHDTIVMYIRENDSAQLVCRNGSRSAKLSSGLHTIVVNPGCQMISESFIFEPQVEVDISSTFVDQHINFAREELLDQMEDHELDWAYKELSKIEPIKAMDLRQLKDLIYRSKSAQNHSVVMYGLLVLSVMISVAIVGYLVYLYCKMKAKKIAEKP